MEEPLELESPSVSIGDRVRARLRRWWTVEYVQSPAPWNGVIVFVCLAAAILWAWHYTDYAAIAALAGALSIAVRVAQHFKVPLTAEVVNWTYWPWLLPLTALAYVVSLLWGTLELKPTTSVTSRRVDVVRSGAKDVKSVVLPDKGSTKVRLSLFGGRRYTAALAPYGCTDVVLDPFSVTTLLLPDQMTHPTLRIVPTPAILASARSGEHHWRLLVLRNGRRIAEAEPYRGEVLTCGCDGVRLGKDDTIEAVIERFSATQKTWKRYANTPPYRMTAAPGQELTIDAPH